jgi:hypothetical protein
MDKLVPESYEVMLVNLLKSQIEVIINLFTKSAYLDLKTQQTIIGVALLQNVE